MITCGGQATNPIVHAGSRVAPVSFAEIVTSIASRSAGPGTRANIDEFTETTSHAITQSIHAMVEQVQKYVPGMNCAAIHNSMARTRCGTAMVGSRCPLRSRETWRLPARVGREIWTS